MITEQPPPFTITVQYRKRTYQYNVIRQRVSEEEEEFRIVAGKRTVVIKSHFRLTQQEGFRLKNVFTYKDKEITNKSLMNRSWKQSTRNWKNNSSSG